MEAQLVAALKGTLEPDGAVIRAAERHLQDDLHPHPDAGLALVHIVFADAATSGLPLALRQAAAVNLTKWIKERWSVFFAEFIGFPSQQQQGANPTASSSSNASAAAATADASTVALSPEHKAPIRDALLGALTLPQSKLRGPMIKALIGVAACDWPDEFMELLPRIKALLHIPSSADGQQQLGTEGALAFLDEWFYSSMDETSLMSITREIFPDLERLLADSILSPQIRCHCISILNQTLETLYMVKEQYPEASKTVAQELLPKWLAILEAVVAANPAAIVAQGGLVRRSGEELALQEQAWKTLVTATHFASHIKPRLQALLARALAALHSLQRPFEIFHIYPTDADIDAPDDIAFFATPLTLAGKIIDFVGMLLQKGSFRTVIDSNALSTFIPLLRAYSRITASEEEEWLADVAQFVAAGDDDEVGALSVSLRSRCADVLGETLAAKPADLLAALQVAVKSAHNDAEARRKAQQAAWWKEEEASLALVGGQAENLVERVEEAQSHHQPLPFDVEGLFSQSVMPYMTVGTPPFLYGRCFVFASQFSSILPADLANSFLEAAVSALEDTTRVDVEGDDIVKLSAVRCIKNFHRHLPEQSVQPYAERILSRVAPLLSQESEDLLILIIETLQAVAAQREPSKSVIPAHIYGELAAACLQAWARQPNLRAVQMVVDDLLEQFAAQGASATAASTLNRSVPILSELLTREAGNADRPEAAATIEGTLGFASALTRGASATILAESNVVGSLFPALFAVIDKTDDRELYQSAAELLSDLFDKAPDACVSWNDGHGGNAILHTLGLVSKMVSSDDTAESGGLAPGNLITTILRKQPQSLAEHLPGICRALVSRLATSQTPSLTQSMVVPLAYLMKDHLDTVVDLLMDYSVNMPDGSSKPALVVLLCKWVEFAPSVQGFWHERVSAIGLCGLFAARKRNASLASLIDGIVVDGDLLPDDVNIIKTRSRSKKMPDRFTQVTVPAKIVKVLAAEYKESVDGPPRRSGGGVGGGEEANAIGEDNVDDGEWNDDDDDEDDDGDQDASTKRFLSDLLGEDVDDELGELVRRHDEDKFGDDPVWNMPYRTYLANFLRELAHDAPTAAAIAPHLNVKEVAILRSVVG